MKASRAFHRIFLASSAPSSLLFQPDPQRTHCSLDCFMFCSLNVPANPHHILSKFNSFLKVCVLYVSGFQGVFHSQRSPLESFGGLHGQTCFCNTKTLVLFHVFTLLTFNTVVERQRNQRSNCQHSLGHRKSKRVSEKHLLLLYWLCQSLWLWITTNCGKFFKRWEYQTTLPASWEICMQVKKQQLEPDMEQQTGSKLGKEYVKAVYCHLAYLTFMQSTSCKMPG